MLIALTIESTMLVMFGLFLIFGWLERQQEHRAEINAGLDELEAYANEPWEDEDA